MDDTSAQVEQKLIGTTSRELLLVTIESEQATPCLSQAQRMKKMSKEDTLSDNQILKIMMEQKKADCRNLSISMKDLSKYFPSSYTPQQMQKTIFMLLDPFSYHIDFRQGPQIGTERVQTGSINHPEESHMETKVIKAAYDEVVPIGYVCTGCGATK